MGVRVSRSSQAPIDMALENTWSPAISELQGRCLPRVKWELNVTFDVIPKWLGGCFYLFLFLCHIREENIKPFSWMLRELS